MAPSPRYSRASSHSPSRSTSLNTSTTGQPRVQIVKRLVIKGRAERESDGQNDGAAVKMYLRLALPANSVVPGSTIPLFPEENLKILNSKVHPLNSNLAPYYYSEREHSLLEKATRALNLQPRLRESYMSLFGSPVSSSSANTSPAAEGSKKYHGEITVSGYHISYVVPKELPPRVYETENSSKRSTNELHFMAAIELWIPYLSNPPFSPYLVSIPVPRCLSNHIRLRIFPPSLITSSMASLSSSGSEPSSWDLTSDPPVSRNGTKRIKRNNSYQGFADDESSDSASPSGLADGYGVQGSFPSTDRIRVRWAAPMKGEVPETSDGRRRIGIRDVRGDMTCSVLGRYKGKTRGRRDAYEGGVVMKLEYNATCRGVWFPGVATMLGMDVALDAGDCEVSWSPEDEQKWVVSGGAGFTGYATGPPPQLSLSRQSSAGAPPINFITPSSSKKDPRIPNGIDTSELVTRSSASLLRTPLPETLNAGEVSFDESTSPNASPLSSVASLGTIPSSPGRSRASSVGGRDSHITDTDMEDEIEQRPPKVPITVHLNMNELGPPSTNEFSFRVAGTVIVKPKRTTNMFTSSPTSPNTSGSASDSDDASPTILPLPQFHVLYTDKESLSTIVLNETEASNLDIYNSKGNIADAQSRKTVLQPGGQTKCGSDGARIAVRTITSQRMFLRRNPSTESLRRAPSRPRTPSYAARNISSTSMYRERQSFSIMGTKPRRDGPLMIPSVTATITPLVSHDSGLPDGYAVCVSLPAPSEADSEWLEFGLVQPSKPAATTDVKAKKASVSSSKEKNPPRVEVASASVEGVPVLFETSTASKPDSKLPALGLTFEETSAKEWITWVKVHVGEAGGGKVQVVYLVKASQDEPASIGRSLFRGLWRRGKPKNTTALDILLPTFSLPVGTMEVNIDSLSDVDVSVRSNLTQRQATSAGLRLLSYSLTEFFYPDLTIAFSRNASTRNGWTSIGWSIVFLLLCICLTVLALLAMMDKQILAAELLHAQQSLESYSLALENPTNLPDTVTMTMTETTTTTVAITMTSTTTIYTSSQATSLQSSDASPTDAGTSAINSSTPSKQSPVSSVLTTLTPIVSPTTTSSADPSSQTDLSHVRDMPFLWPVRLDIPSLQIPEVARATVSTLWRGVGIAWYLFQKLLHYPLDPP